MNIKKLLIDSFIKVASRASEITARDRDIDIVLSWALQKVSGSKDVLFPADYVKLLRDGRGTSVRI